MIASLFFYLFALMTIASGVMVISARNPVHAVLFLILAFFNASGLFILMGAEFIAMLLVVVYVGAVAVLFLFVVMMLDINFADMREGFHRHLPIALIVGAVLFVELVLVFSGAKTTIGVAPVAGDRSNIARIGDVLYTDYFYLFQIAGIILLVAMIGAITLTMRQREGVKRQSIAVQNARRRDETVAVIDVETGVAPKPLVDDASQEKKVLR
jgi:NADH-quinone oxidoreductase subunit J